MTREFIYKDTGEFGFNQFHELTDDKWSFIDLEVDCDVITIKNFKEQDDLRFQFWLSDDKTTLGIASKFFGHMRQANIPLQMLKTLKITLARPAKAGGEFDLSIDSEMYRGEIIRGEINLKSQGFNWDMTEYESKKGILCDMADKLIHMTGGQLTKRQEYINA